jgi:hypothetical protein
LEFFEVLCILTIGLGDLRTCGGGGVLRCWARVNRSLERKVGEGDVGLVGNDEGQMAGLATASDGGMDMTFALSSL